MRRIISTCRTVPAQDPNFFSGLLIDLIEIRTRHPRVVELGDVVILILYDDRPTDFLICAFRAAAPYCTSHIIHRSELI